MSKGMNKNTTLGIVRLVQQTPPDVDWDKKENYQLLEALLALQNPDEAGRFLRDLMTAKDIKEFANRLEAAKLLSEDVQYNTISESTGLSSTTIARLAKWLYGSLGGYRLILARLSGTSSHHRNSSQLRKGLSLSS